MSGNIPLLPLQAFTEWSGTASPSYIQIHDQTSTTCTSKVKDNVCQNTTSLLAGVNETCFGPLGCHHQVYNVGSKRLRD